MQNMRSFCCSVYGDSVISLLNVGSLNKSTISFRLLRLRGNILNWKNSLLFQIIRNCSLIICIPCKMVLFSLSVAMPGSVEDVRQVSQVRSVGDITQRQVGKIKIRTIQRGTTPDKTILGSSTRDFQMQPGGNDDLCIYVASKEKVISDTSGVSDNYDHFNIPMHRKREYAESNTLSNWKLIFSIFKIIDERAYHSTLET